MLALIIFTPLDNFVHKLIKMYLNPSKRNEMEMAMLMWLDLELWWRRVWLICRAASNDKEQATGNSLPDVSIPLQNPYDSIDMWRDLTVWGATR